MKTSAAATTAGPPVFAGLKVVDLTQGIAGAITTMLLADAGAEVVRVKLAGDPFVGLSGYRVWHRGKRVVHLDLAKMQDRLSLEELIADADVLVEASASPLKEIDLDTIAANYPRLIWCSISGYGDAANHRDRRAVEALVAARTGLYWEARGIPGTTIGALSGWEDPLDGIDLGLGSAVGPEREGPMYLGIPWASNAAAYLAMIAISAALRARQVSGIGQHVATSLLQGVLCAGSIAWQRCENPYAEGYLGWTTDPRAPKGFYKSSDDKWIQQWVQLPSFMLGVSAGDKIVVPESGASPKDAELRISTDYQDMVMLGYFHPEMATAAAKFTAAEWEAAAQEANVPFEIVQPPEAALLDESLLADGCVAEFVDDEVGRIRAVGDVIRLSDCRSGINPLGESAESEATPEPALTEYSDPSAAVKGLSAPLAGIRVLDLGLAIAGPFGAQMLASLGADVIRVSSRHDDAWMKTQYSHMSNRGKRDIVIDLKTNEGKQIFDALVKTADVVHHNMRDGAARRLGVDTATLREINPTLIYCHTRGYEHGAREGKPANDQTGGALAGTEWVDGAADNGGTPIWPSVSLGDTGNGLLSAIGVIQALYHRDRTGKGQDVDTSIIYAHLLNASMAWTAPDGTQSGDRPVIDSDSWGVSALERIYPSRDGWICLSVTSTDDWRKLLAAIPVLAEQDVPDAIDGALEVGALAELLKKYFRTHDTQTLMVLLDEHGVPAEAMPSSPAVTVFDDDDLKAKGLIETYEHPELGRMEMAGRLIDIVGATSLGPAPTFGAHTREVLGELGFANAEIDAFAASGVIGDATSGVEV